MKLGSTSNNGLVHGPNCTSVQLRNHATHRKQPRMVECEQLSCHAHLKQKRIAKDLLENFGTAISRAILDAGYAPGMANNSSELTESKGWHELMKQYLPDGDLFEKHQDDLLDHHVCLALSRSIPCRALADPLLSWAWHALFFSFWLA